MGRGGPTKRSDYPFADTPSLQLFLASRIAATIVMITSLCGVRFRRRPQSSSKDGKEKDSSAFKSKITETAAAAAAAVASAPRANDEVELDDAKVEIPRSQELPLPPARKHLNESHSYNQLPRAASTKNNLKVNLSVKVPRSRSVSKHHGQDGKKEKLKREDSIWTKAIILGEKCRVPDDDDDGAIIYDNQGNRISAYRARTPRSLPISRTNSTIDQDAIPSQ